VNALGETIRILMGRRQLTGVQLAEDIGLSATSVSRILTGHSNPKQVTFTRLMKRLCESPEEEQMMLRAFTGLKAPAVEEPVTEDPRNAVEERERVERWLEARTQAITFKDAVARELDKAGIFYRRDVCEGFASADFLIEHGPARIAIECKFNVSRDFDKTVGIARLLCELLHCTQVFIVVPFDGTFSADPVTASQTIKIGVVAEAIRSIHETIGTGIKIAK
jgi:transcriptional regulator with XRE-family HTH domain